MQMLDISGRDVTEGETTSALSRGEGEDTPRIMTGQSNARPPHRAQRSVTRLVDKTDRGDTDMEVTATPQPMTASHSLRKRPTIPTSFSEVVSFISQDGTKFKTETRKY